VVIPQRRWETAHGFKDFPCLSQLGLAMIEHLMKRDKHPKPIILASQGPPRSQSTAGAFCGHARQLVACGDVSGATSSTI